MLWLLEQNVKSALEHAYTSNAWPTVEQQADYMASFHTSSAGTARLLTVADNLAKISIEGVLTKAPNLAAMLFGGGNTTYPEIITALAEANADPRVKRIQLAIDSGGGQFHGLFDAIAAIQAANKPVDAVIANTGASAAFALAAQADTITAANRAAQIGSVGVAATFGVDDGEVTITSTAAPKKRPDVTTEEGVATVREELDALHEIFVESIAQGRDTTIEKVNANFGQGATLLADEALKRGMIDAIAGPSLRVVESAETTTARSGGNNLETGTMNREDLIAQHPDVYAAVLQEGVDKERDRVTAHLTMGEAAGATKLAIDAITKGEEYTAKHMAQYNAAALNNGAIAARQDDDIAAAAADNATLSDNQDTTADMVASLVEARLGIGG